MPGCDHALDNLLGDNPHFRGLCGTHRTHILNFRIQTMELLDDSDRSECETGWSHRKTDGGGLVKIDGNTVLQSDPLLFSWHSSFHAVQQCSCSIN